MSIGQGVAFPAKACLKRAALSRPCGGVSGESSNAPACDCVRRQPLAEDPSVKMMTEIVTGILLALSVWTFIEYKLTQMGLAGGSGKARRAAGGRGASASGW